MWRASWKLLWFLRMSVLKTKLISSEPCSRSLIWIMYESWGQQTGCASISSFHITSRWNLLLGWPGWASWALTASSTNSRTGVYISSSFFSKFFPLCPILHEAKLHKYLIPWATGPRSRGGLHPPGEVSLWLAPPGCLKPIWKCLCLDRLQLWAGTCLCVGRLWDGCWSHSVGWDMELRTIPSAPHHSAPCHRPGWLSPWYECWAASALALLLLPEASLHYRLDFNGRWKRGRGTEVAEPALCWMELRLAPIPRQQPCHCEQGACKPSPLEKPPHTLKKKYQAKLQQCVACFVTD